MQIKKVWKPPASTVASYKILVNQSTDTKYKRYLVMKDFSLLVSKRFIAVNECKYEFLRIKNQYWWQDIDNALQIGIGAYQFSNIPLKIYISDHHTVEKSCTRSLNHSI